MLKGSKISMQSLRMSAHTQQAPRIRRSSGQNSNRHKKLLETHLNHTKQRTACRSNRHKMRTFFAAHHAAFLDSLPLNVLARRTPSVLNQRGFQVVSVFACSSLVTRHLLAPRYEGPLVSNRQFSELPELEINLSDTKQHTSLFLTANFGRLFCQPEGTRQHD